MPCGAGPAAPFLHICMFAARRLAGLTQGTFPGETLVEGLYLQRLQDIDSASRAALR